MSATFTDLGVPPRLVQVLATAGITAPFPIQQDTLPDTLAGKDVLGRGRTGSGKTLAFALPMVARLADEGTRTRPGHPRGLVLAPTRELASQIADVVAPLAAASGLTVTTIFGGVNQNPQVRALADGVDIVVACPGRLDDLMKQKHAFLDQVRITVLDEADHMADLGFLPTVTRLMAATPSTGQRLLFSATLDNGVDRLVTRFLHTPTLHSVDDETSPVEQMEHAVFTVSPEAKKAVVSTLASGATPRILFVRTKHVAKKLAKQLQAEGIAAVDLQGNLSQAARERHLAALKSGEARVLVATDVAARGVHIDDVALVVHVDPPIEHKSYLHRSGRTARAGAAGTVVTLVLPEQRKDVATLLRRAAIRVTPQEVTAASAPVLALVGERAPLVHAPVAAAPAQRPASAGSSRSGGPRRRPAAGRAGGTTSPSSSAASAPQRPGQASARPADARSADARPASAGSTTTRRGPRGSAPAQPARRHAAAGLAAASAPRRSGSSAPRRASRPAGPSA